MRLRNSIGIETRFGYKLIELFEGDVTDPDISADLLVVSAFAGDYSPIAGTLIGALFKVWGIELTGGIIDYDLRRPLSIWISKDLSKGNYRRLLCVELLGGFVDIGSAISNVFAGVGILEAKGIAPKTIVMPLLGTGQQYLDSKQIVSVLIPEARNALERLLTLEKIIFIDIDRKKADELDEAINEYLGRSSVSLPKDELIANLKSDICSLLDKFYPSKPYLQKSFYEDMRRLLATDEVRSFEIGILARRYVESLVNAILPDDKPVHNLANGIDQTANFNVAPWIRSYMHTLRLIGNESAHEKIKGDRRPPFVGEDDLVITLFCIQRLLVFWSNSYGK